LIIAAFAVGPEAGFLMLAMRVMGLPKGLVGTSVAQVYLAEASERHIKGDLGRFTRKMMWTLLKSGAPPLIIAATICPFLFPVLFGEEWARAGVMVVWLTPMFILQFVVSPVSTALHILGKLNTAMLVQMVGGVFRVTAVVLAAQFYPAILVETFAISSAIFYLAVIPLLYFILRGADRFPK
jgi:O-antigen/teichoic acid export membrane protein